MPYNALSLRLTLTFSMFLLLIAAPCFSQDSLSRPALDEVIIKAFDQNRKLRDIPAAINYINRLAMERFNNQSLVQAVNATPGVRWEERSPGSYRFSIRGSTLRSPFGVRNLKVYFNDLPITDPGGQTYLNQLGYYNFNSLEIIKGPGSSLYGAGTGGVLLIESLSGKEGPGVQTEFTMGSYGLLNAYASVTSGSAGQVSKASFQHQQSNGYRDHSALKREVYSWNGQFRFSGNKMLKAGFLYGDLFYETPGGLNAAEWSSDPRASRPAVGNIPGAIEARASVRQRSFLAGASYDQQLAPHLKNKSTLYGMFTELKNPTLRNYGKNAEPHAGGRTVFRYEVIKRSVVLNWDLGAEWQEGFSTLTTYSNHNGSADSLQNVDEVHNRNQFIFTQGTLEWNHWILTIGASINRFTLKFQRFDPLASASQLRQFNNQAAPRIAVLRKMGDASIYGSISRGFSPPSTAELLPTGGPVNMDLVPETGINYDLGIKGNFRGIFFDVNAFYFSLKGTIVQRRDSAGGGYFINAGMTRQTGIETSVNVPLFPPGSPLASSLFWLSHTWHRFNYKSFSQLNVDYSGKRMPGEPAHMLVTGIELKHKNGWMGGINYGYNSLIYLNDANTSHGEPGHLLGIHAGWQHVVGNQWQIKFNMGGDNLLDQDQSLGYDLNAAGGRYYNAAAGRNYYVSLMIQWVSKKALQ